MVDTDMTVLFIVDTKHSSGVRIAAQKEIKLINEAKEALSIT